MNELKPIPVAAGAKIGDAPEVLNVSSSEMDEIVEQTGFTTISKGMSRNLAKLGVGLDALGRVKTNSGMLLLTHQAMLKAVYKLQKRLDDPDMSDETLKLLTQSLGYISEKLAKSVKVSNESSETPTQLVSEGKLRRGSFTPGAVVQYNFYGTEKKVEQSGNVG